LKSHKSYQSFDPIKDPGYLVVFEHINEAAELLFKKTSQTILSELMGEKNASVP
jgi:hypothetical protein